MGLLDRALRFKRPEEKRVPGLLERAKKFKDFVQKDRIPVREAGVVGLFKRALSLRERGGLFARAAKLRGELSESSGLEFSSSPPPIPASTTPHNVYDEPLIAPAPSFDDVPLPEFLVRADARHADAALSRDPDPAIRAVPQSRLGRHVPAPGRAEIPRGRRVLHLPDGPVLPRPAARARRGGDDGRLRAVEDLSPDLAAALEAGAGDRGDLLIHLDLGRFLRAADLPQRHQQLHRAAGAAQLRRLDGPL